MSKRGLAPSFEIQVRSVPETRTSGNTPPPSDTLRIPITGYNGNLEIPDPKERPSTVFDDGQENSKGFWSKRAIVARDVTGWLVGPARNDEAKYGPGASEDWHYRIYLDPDFIERTYGSGLIAPLAGAVMTGNQNEFWVGTPPPRISLLNGSPPTAGTFLMPGADPYFEVELNAWHMRDTPQGHGRSTPPLGWVLDPYPDTYSNNAWPFDPRYPTGDDPAKVSADPLKAGDYVILSGTLWQDSGHLGEETSEGERHCWNSAYKNHAGWLELHPIDFIRRVRPAPKLRKHAVHVSACAWPGDQKVVEKYLSPEEVGVHSGEKSVLKFQEIPDTRFTRMESVSEHIVEIPSCEPPRLRVRVKLDGTRDFATFNATYVTWWEDGNSARTESSACPSPGGS